MIRLTEEMIWVEAVSELLASELLAMEAGLSLAASKPLGTRQWQMPCPPNCPPKGDPKPSSTVAAEVMGLEGGSVG